VPAAKFVPKGRCRCGKSNADCCAWWDAHLGITGNATEDYRKNRRAIAVAKAAGEDPYHVKLNSRSGH